MKLVTAVIKPYLLDAVKEALHALGVAGARWEAWARGALAERGRDVASLVARSVAPALERGDGAWYVLGCHPCEHGGVDGARFVVWAPNARRVSVIGDFNGWDSRVHCMRRRYDGGLYDIFIPDVKPGDRYKFELLGPHGERLPPKADPFAFAAEKSPATASIVCEPPHRDVGDAWRTTRAAMTARDAPIAIYECHLGSWARVPEEGNRYLTYAELADRLIPYVKDLGFTHIEVLPISEYPFDGSWGYQPVSLFAPTSRFGTPDDFMAFVEKVHAAGLGLIVDWVPAHFPNDPHGLAEFDGTHLYEHADPRQGFHQDWGTSIISTGPRWRVFSCPMQNSGCNGTAWMDCASMRSPRCFTSIIRGSRANGCRTNTAGGKISGPSRS